MVRSQDVPFAFCRWYGITMAQTVFRIYILSTATLLAKIFVKNVVINYICTGIKCIVSLSLYVIQHHIAFISSVWKCWLSGSLP